MIEEIKTTESPQSRPDPSPNSEPKTKSSSSVFRKTEQQTASLSSAPPSSSRPLLRGDRLTSEELSALAEVSSFRWLMGILGLIYFAMAVIYFFYPSELLYFLNIGPNVFHVSEALPEPKESFFRVQGMGFMLTLGILSWLSARSPQDPVLGWVQVAVHAAATSAFVSLLMSAPSDRNFFAYYLAIGFSALVIILLLIGLTRSSMSIRKAKRRKLLHGNIWGDSEASSARGGSGTEASSARGGSSSEASSARGGDPRASSARGGSHNG